MTRPRVVVLTNLTTRNSLPVIEALRTSSELDLCHVVFYDTLKRSRGKFREVIRHYGLRRTTIKVAELLARKLRLLLIKRCGWRLSNKARSSYEFVVAHQIPFSIETNLNARSCIEFLSRLGPEVLLTCNFSQIVRPALISVPRAGAVNVHLSLLPRRRGPLPVFWALYHGDRETGVTFHLISEGIDEGEILGRFVVPVPKETDEDTLTARLATVAGSHVAAVITDWLAGRIQPLPQDGSLATYEGFPTRQQRGESV